MFPNLIDLIFTSSFPTPSEELIIPPPLCFIRSLQLEVPKLSLLYVEHLTSGIPDCLDSLEINLTDIHLGD